MKTLYVSTFVTKDNSMMITDIIDECKRVQTSFVRDEATGIRWELWFPQQRKQYR